MTIGKAIAGGIPIGAYGLSAELAARVEALDAADLVDVGGVGGTLAGNALSLAAARATLGEVLTEEAFEAMMALCDRFVAGVRTVLDERDVPWSIAQLGARAELAFAPDPPRSGGASAALHDAALEDALHLFLLNRGVMITPFHNMALMSPATTEADVDRHTEVFARGRRSARLSRVRLAVARTPSAYPPRGRLPPTAKRTRALADTECRTTEQPMTEGSR